MYLSKLEIFGFKSFAQKTKLKFSDGICCVIGPNGSGKSNIVDAIRWVLGEQKVSSLRTDKMDSLIFNGTSTRKPLGMTEVALTVQNNKNILKSSFSEVVISRRLYRSGESQYMLNKTPCRLKDIQDMFMDTGMGADSYSVIELKMVEDIISENPSDRRHLFEEAAGVTRYKNRRKSALRKLEATVQDMSRISDLMSEITRTVNSLGRQVGKARRYLNYKEELKKKEIELARYRYSRLLDDVQPIEKQLEEISAIKEDTSHQITLEEALLEEYKREMIQIETTLMDFNKQVYDQDQRIHQLKEEEAVALTKIQALNETIHRNKQDIDEYQEKVKNLSNELDINQEKLREIEQNLTGLQNEWNKKEKEQKEKEEKLIQVRSSLEEVNADVRTLQEELLISRSELQNKKYHIQIFQDQLASFENEEKNSGKKQEEINQKKKSIERTKHDLDKRSSSISATINKLQNSVQQIDKQISSKNETIQQNTAQLDIIAGRVKFYEQIISKYEGHTQSTRYIMTNRHNLPGLHGPLSDLVNVNDDYKLAIESALGDALNYLVVDDTHVAKRIIDRVIKEDQGRITLLPLDRLNQISDNDDIYSFHLPLLSNLVSCEKPYEKIFRLLLGDIALADNLDRALEESLKYPTMRYVTRNGEMINSGSSISGGGKFDTDSSIIGRREQLLKLTQMLKNLQQSLIKNRDELNELEHKKESELHALQQYMHEMDQLSSRQSEIEKQTSQLNFEQNSLTETISQREVSRKKTNQSIASYQSDLLNIENVLSGKTIQLEDLEKKNQKITQIYKEKDNHFQESVRALQDLRLKIITEQNRLNNCESDIQRSRATISELDQLTDKRRKQIEEVHQQLKQIEVENKERKENQTKIWEARDKIDLDKEKIQDSYHELKDKILHLENQIKKYRKQHDTSLERSRQLELSIQEKRMKADAIMQRIKEEYKQDISIGIAYNGLEVEETEQEIETLKFKIAQLGLVNPLAVSEYDKESERLTFYKKQYEDLEEAEKSLRKTISKINITARKQFLESFQSIKVNFERVFNRFFDSGEGTLKLEENTDPLEANIEILVRPKGKRVQTINLLSGGEKTLTAISLLFAIYLVKPSPFCILDEIDAPLDDVNISRFTKALKEF